MFANVTNLFKLKNWAYYDIKTISDACYHNKPNY